MTNDYSPDILTLSDEEGKNTEFEILDIIEFEGKNYYVLLPRYQDPETALRFSADFIILRADSDTDETYFSVPADDIAGKISCIFEERYNSSFYDE